MDNDKVCCDASVVSSETLTGADNYPVHGGQYKIPKVLAEFVIQIDSESKIRLNEPSYEIKRIDKEVFLTQCRYIPPTDKVFISGYIRKNIEYASRKCTTENGIGGVIKDTTVHIPFRAYTKVKFKSFPKIHPNPQAKVARYFDEKRMGKNIREADRSNAEIFNEPVYCELEWSAVYDADIDDKGTPIDGFINEEEFDEFTDKSVVYLCIKLLQKQQVHWKHHKEEDGTGEEPKDEVSEKVYCDWDFPMAEVVQEK